MNTIFTVLTVGRRGTSRADVIAIISVVLLFALLFCRTFAESNRDSELSVCVNNVRQIMAAIAMYSSDNDDHLPHPSWGADLSGPDNWAYATKLPNGQSGVQLNANGLAGPDAYKRQIPLFNAGQLAPFIGGKQRLFVCPMDWRESMTTKAALYRDRPQKLTSYSMSGVVGSYVGPFSKWWLNGKTYKASDFLPADMILWEQADGAGFYFNDAGNNPETIGEGISSRHGAPSAQGFGCAGTVGGAAQVVRTERFEALQRDRGASDLKCGPSYRR